MKAVTFDPATDRFSLRTLSEPECGPEDVLVKVLACGLNPVDSKIVSWKQAATGMNSDWVAGLDVAGEIHAVGGAVADWKVGDRVLYHGNMFRPCGGFAEYAVHRAATLLPLPDLDATLAAATPCAGWTAYRAMVDKLNLKPQDSLLIAGGSGGVDGFSIQIAASLGVRTIIATCSAANAEYVRSLGATDVIDYRQENVTESVLEITAGRGVDCGLDAVGGDNDLLVANSLAFDGRMTEIVTIVRPREYERTFERGLTFHQLSLGAAHGRTDTEELISRAGAAFTELLSAGKIQVPALEAIDIEQVPEALARLASQRVVGKIVWRP